MPTLADEQPPSHNRNAKADKDDLLHQQIVVAPGKDSQRQEDADGRELREDGAEPLRLASGGRQRTGKTRYEAGNGAQIIPVRLAEFAGEKTLFAKRQPQQKDRNH